MDNQKLQQGRGLTEGQPMMIHDNSGPYKPTRGSADAIREAAMRGLAVMHGKKMSENRGTSFVYDSGDSVNIGDLASDKDNNIFRVNGMTESEVILTSPDLGEVKANRKYVSVHFSLMRRK